MKIIGIGGNTTGKIEEELRAAGHEVTHAPHGVAALELVRESAFDLVLFIGYEHLEEVECAAEVVINGALAGPGIAVPYVFVEWGQVLGVESAREYGLKFVDLMVEDCTPKRIDQAYESAQHNEM